MLCFRPSLRMALARRLPEVFLIRVNLETARIQLVGATHGAQERNPLLPAPFGKHELLWDDVDRIDDVVRTGELGEHLAEAVFRDESLKRRHIAAWIDSQNHLLHDLTFGKADRRMEDNGLTADVRW